MRKLTALLLTALLLFGTVGTALGLGRTNRLNMPVYDHEANCALGTLEFMDYISGTSLLPANCTGIVRFPPNVPVVSFTVYDANQTFDSINSYVYGRDVCLEFGNRIPGSSASVLVDITADLTDANSGGLAVSIESIPTHSFSGASWVLAYVNNPNVSDSANAANRGDSDDDSDPLPFTPATSVVEPTVEPTATIISESDSEVIKSIFAIDNTSYIFGDVTQTMDVAPYAKDNRTYIPVRYLAYSLGVSPEGIAWNQESQTVTVTSNGTTVVMTIGSTTMTVNGTPITMDVAPEAVDGRTMLPARYLAEALGATVTWNTTTNSIEIEKSGN